MMKMIIYRLMIIITLLPFNSCKKEKAGNLPPVEMPLPPILLKEIHTLNLPSPHYYFEYSLRSQPIFASVASGLFMYDITYKGNSIDVIKNNTAANKDRLQYVYNQQGKPDTIRITDQDGRVYKKIYFSYAEQKIIKASRVRESGGSFIIEKMMTFSYHADGNLKELSDHRYPGNGQPEFVSTDLFEEYDDKRNTDSFTLLNNDFFEHFFILGGIVLQKNNPQKVTRSGSGLNYTIIYSYTYNDKNLPLIKTGQGTILAGPDAGKTFHTSSIFSYY